MMTEKRDTPEPPYRFPLFRFPLVGRPVDPYLEELLAPLHGDQLSIEEAMERHGELRIRRAALASALRERTRLPKVRGYPPRIFLSYRWQDKDWMARAQRLADHLRGRGFRVYLDQEHQATLGHQGLGIMDYLSRIVESQVFIAVITPAYLEGEVRVYLTEEGQVARLLSHIDLRIVMLWAHGEALPESWSGGCVIDVRQNPDDFSALDQVLSYDGAVLGDGDEDRLVELLTVVEKLLQQGRYDEVLKRLAENPQLAVTDEYRHAQACAFFGIGRFDEAADLALKVLADGYCSAETRLDLCSLLDEMGEKGPALCYLSSLNPGSSVYGSYVSYLKGNLLDDLGAYSAALNHLRLAEQLHTVNFVALQYPDGVGAGKARKPADFYAIKTDKAEVLNNIGYIHLFRLGKPGKALPHFRNALKLNPDRDDAWANLVACLAALGQNEDAWRELQTASDQLGPRPSLIKVRVALEAGLISPSQLPPPRDLRPTHRCDQCFANYHLGKSDVICAHCGCDYELLAGEGSNCPCCSSRVVVLLGKYASYAKGEKPRCPICREGVLRGSSMNRLLGWVERGFQVNER